MHDLFRREPLFALVDVARLMMMISRIEQEAGPRDRGRVALGQTG